jgi:RNA polymerase sigma-70 factor, ECF subfamily
MSSGIVELGPPRVDECFDDVVLPHLDAAHRLARWLMRNEHDAEDVVQEASLRALRYFRTFTGGNGRAWFLRIVRNTCSRRRADRAHAPTDTFDEERHSSARAAVNPEALLLETDAAAAIDRAMDYLSDRHREMLILRELQGLSYREIADVLGVPIGTVMSGLWRARQSFRDSLDDTQKHSGASKRVQSHEHDADQLLV